MALPITYKKNVNTNRDTTSGNFVENPNPLVSQSPVNFIPNVDQHKYHLREMNIAYQATRFITAPDGVTQWPVVDIDNSDFRNPLGDGSLYDNISVPK